MRFVQTVATVASTTFGTTTPWYMRHNAMYFLWRRTHLTIMEAS